MIDLNAEAFVVLDGKKHEHWIFAGNDTTKLKPGETWNSDFTLANYLEDYAKADFKWSSAILADGPHTLTLHMRGKTYGPIMFVWTSNPFNFKPPLPATSALIPTFYNTQGQPQNQIDTHNDPCFGYTFANTTHQDVNLNDLSHQSSIVLDGSHYSQPEFYWFGSIILRPGQSWTSDVGIREYLPLGRRIGFQWSSRVLAEGSHTLVYTFGGKTYGPVAFLWHTQAP